MSGRLERSRTNRVISGVCGGIAEYLDIDATFVRAVMVILAFPFGVGVLIYFVLLFLMPNPGEATPFVRSTGSEQTAAVDPLNPAAPAAQRVVDPVAMERRRNGIGLLLVAVGVVFLLGNVGAFRFADLRYVWPLVLIALGVYLVAQRTRQ
jgi:phage shock protein C